jgi:hypothetical protein
MNGFLQGPLLAVLSGIALSLAGCVGGGGSSNPPGASAPTVVVQPLPLPGPYAVACSNAVQDFSRMGAGEDVTSYWEGNPLDNDMPRCATDLPDNNFLRGWWGNPWGFESPGGASSFPQVESLSPALLKRRPPAWHRKNDAGFLSNMQRDNGKGDEK